MRRSTGVAVWVATVATLLSPVTGTAQALVFDHVTVVDVERGTLRPEQRVVVVGARIRASGGVDAVSVPPGARVIEARGKYLMPGLWDMHLHLWTAPERVGYPLLIANGVTGLRDPGSPVPLATLTRWKREIAAGTRVGPRLVVAGPSIFHCPLLPPATDYHYGVCVTTPAEARAVVDSLKTAGADFLEADIDSKFTAEPVKPFFALAAAAREAGLPFGGHAPVWIGRGASDSGARFLNNGSALGDQSVCTDWYAKVAGVGECMAAADSLRRHDTWVVLTPPLPRLRYQVSQYQRYIPTNGATGSRGELAHFDIATWFTTAGSLPVAARPTSTMAWRSALGAVDTITGTPLFPVPSDGRVQEVAGLPVVVGTDAVFAPSAFAGLAGFTLHDALAMLVVSGMTPAGALRTATLNPALALHAADSLGIVEAGKVADLVLLDANPLVEINNTTKIRAVVANGRYFDRAALDHLLVEAEQAAQHPR